MTRFVSWSAPGQQPWKEGRPGPEEDHVGTEERPLKPGEGGPYGDLAQRPRPGGLAVVFAPSLAALLEEAEAIQGAPLTQDQVIRIRALRTWV